MALPLPGSTVEGGGLPLPGSFAGGGGLPLPGSNALPNVGAPTNASSVNYPEYYAATQGYSPVGQSYQGYGSTEMGIDAAEERAQMLEDLGLPPDATSTSTFSSAYNDVSTGLGSLYYADPKQAMDLAAQFSGENQDKDFFAQVLDFGKDILNWSPVQQGIKILSILGRPGQVLPELLTDQEEDPWYEDVMQAISGNSTASWSRVLEQEGWDPGWGRAITAFGLEVALDPTTWLMMGAGGQSRILQALTGSEQYTAVKAVEAVTKLDGPSLLTLERELAVPGLASGVAAGQVPETFATKIIQQVRDFGTTYHKSLGQGQTYDEWVAWLASDAPEARAIISADRTGYYQRLAGQAVSGPRAATDPLGAFWNEVNTTFDWTYRGITTGGGLSRYPDLMLQSGTKLNGVEATQHLEEVRRTLLSGDEWLKTGEASLGFGDLPTTYRLGNPDARAGWAYVQALAGASGGGLRLRAAIPFTQYRAMSMPIVPKMGLQYVRDLFQGQAFITSLKDLSRTMSEEEKLLYFGGRSGEGTFESVLDTYLGLATPGMAQGQRGGLEAVRKLYPDLAEVMKFSDGNSRMASKYYSLSEGLGRLTAPLTPTAARYRGGSYLASAAHDAEREATNAAEYLSEIAALNLSERYRDPALPHYNDPRLSTTVGTMLAGTNRAIGKPGATLSSDDISAIGDLPLEYADDPEAWLETFRDLPPEDFAVKQRVAEDALAARTRLRELYGDEFDLRWEGLLRLRGHFDTIKDYAEGYGVPVGNWEYDFNSVSTLFSADIHKWESNATPFARDMNRRDIYLMDSGPDVDLISHQMFTTNPSTGVFGLQLTTDPNRGGRLAAIRGQRIAVEGDAVISEADAAIDGIVRSYEQDIANQASQMNSPQFRELIRKAGIDPDRLAPGATTEEVRQALRTEYLKQHGAWDGMAVTVGDHYEVTMFGPHNVKFHSLDDGKTNPIRGWMPRQFSETVMAELQALLSNGNWGHGSMDIKAAARAIPGDTLSDYYENAILYLSVKPGTAEAEEVLQKWSDELGVSASELRNSGLSPKGVMSRAEAERLVADDNLLEHDMTALIKGYTADLADSVKKSVWQRKFMRMSSVAANTDTAEHVIARSDLITNYVPKSNVIRDSVEKMAEERGLVEEAWMKAAERLTRGALHRFSSAQEYRMQSEGTIVDAATLNKLYDLDLSEDEWVTYRMVSAGTGRTELIRDPSGTVHPGLGWQGPRIGAPKTFMRDIRGAITVSETQDNVYFGGKWVDAGTFSKLMSKDYEQFKAGLADLVTFRRSSDGSVVRSRGVTIEEVARRARFHAFSEDGESFVFFQGPDRGLMMQGDMLKSEDALRNFFHESYVFPRKQVVWAHRGDYENWSRGTQYEMPQTLRQPLKLTFDVDRTPVDPHVVRGEDITNMEAEEGTTLFLPYGEWYESDGPWTEVEGIELGANVMGARWTDADGNTQVYINPNSNALENVFLGTGDMERFTPVNNLAATFRMDLDALPAPGETADIAENIDRIVLTADSSVLADVGSQTLELADGRRARVTVRRGGGTVTGWEHLPAKGGPAGVYVWRDADRNILYVGQSADTYSRIRSHILDAKAQLALKDVGEEASAQQGWWLPQAVSVEVFEAEKMLSELGGLDDQVSAMLLKARSRDAKGLRAAQDEAERQLEQMQRLIGHDPAKPPRGGFGPEPIVRLDTNAEVFDWEVRSLDDDAVLAKGYGPYNAREGTLGEHVAANMAETKGRGAYVVEVGGDITKPGSGFVVPADFATPNEAVAYLMQRNGYYAHGMGADGIKDKGWEVVERPGLTPRYRRTIPAADIPGAKRALNAAIIFPETSDGAFQWVVSGATRGRGEADDLPTAMHAIEQMTDAVGFRGEILTDEAIDAAVNTVRSSASPELAKVLSPARGLTGTKALAKLTTEDLMNVLGHLVEMENSGLNSELLVQVQSVKNYLLHQMSAPAHAVMNMAQEEPRLLGFVPGEDIVTYAAQRGAAMDIVSDLSQGELDGPLNKGALNSAAELKKRLDKVIKNFAVVSDDYLFDMSDADKLLVKRSLQTVSDALGDRGSDVQKAIDQSKSQFGQALFDLYARPDVSVSRAAELMLEQADEGLRLEVHTLDDTIRAVKRVADKEVGLQYYSVAYMARSRLNHPPDWTAHLGKAGSKPFNQAVASMLAMEYGMRPVDIANTYVKRIVVDDVLQGFQLVSVRKKNAVSAAFIDRGENQQLFQFMEKLVGDSDQVKHVIPDRSRTDISHDIIDALKDVAVPGTKDAFGAGELRKAYLSEVKASLGEEVARVSAGHAYYDTTAQYYVGQGYGASQLYGYGSSYVPRPPLKNLTLAPEEETARIQARALEKAAAAAEEQFKKQAYSPFDDNWTPVDVLNAIVFDSLGRPDAQVMPIKYGDLKVKEVAGETRYYVHISQRAKNPRFEPFDAEIRKSVYDEAIKLGNKVADGDPVGETVLFDGITDVMRRAAQEKWAKRPQRQELRVRGFSMAGLEPHLGIHSDTRNIYGWYTRFDLNDGTLTYRDMRELNQMVDDMKAGKPIPVWSSLQLRALLRNLDMEPVNTLEMAAQTPEAHALLDLATKFQEQLGQMSSQFQKVDRTTIETILHNNLRGANIPPELGRLLPGGGEQQLAQALMHERAGMARQSLLAHLESIPESPGRNALKWAVSQMDAIADYDHSLATYTRGSWAADKQAIQRYWEQTGPSLVLASLDGDPKVIGQMRAALEQEIQLEMKRLKDQSDMWAIGQRGRRSGEVAGTNLRYETSTGTSRTIYDWDKFREQAERNIAMRRYAGSTYLGSEQDIQQVVASYAPDIRPFDPALHESSKLQVYGDHATAPDDAVWMLTRETADGPVHRIGAEGFVNQGGLTRGQVTSRYFKDLMAEQKALVKGGKRLDPKDALQVARREENVHNMARAVMVQHGVKLEFPPQMTTRQRNLWEALMNLGTEEFVSTARKMQEGKRVTTSIIDIPAGEEALVDALMGLRFLTIEGQQILPEFGKTAVNSVRLPGMKDGDAVMVLRGLDEVRTDTKAAIERASMGGLNEVWSQTNTENAAAVAHDRMASHAREVQASLRKMSDIDAKTQKTMRVAYGNYSSATREVNKAILEAEGLEAVTKQAIRFADDVPPKAQRLMPMMEVANGYAGLKFYAHPYIAKEFEDMFAHKTPNALHEGYRHMLSVWKRLATMYYPGFHVRNSLGAYLMNAMGGVSERDYDIAGSLAAAARSTWDIAGETTGGDRRLARAAELLSEDDYAYLNLNSLFGDWDPNMQWTYKDVTEFYQSMGVGMMNSRAVADTFEMFDKLGKEASTKERGIIGQKWDWYTDRMFHLNERIESLHRFAAMNRGMSSFNGDAWSAHAFTMMRHGDYTDLTALEHGFLRDIIPFYKWLRTNIPFQFQMLLENPVWALTAIKTKRLVIEGQGYDYDKVQAALPEYMKNDYAYMVNIPGVKNGLNFLLADLPMNEIYKGTNEYFSSFLPLIRPLFETAVMKKSIFTGRPLEDTSMQRMNSVFAKIPLVPDLLATMGFAYKDTKGDFYIKAGIDNLLTTIPVYARFRNWVISGDDNAAARAGALGSALFGLSSKPVTEADLTQEEQNFYYSQIQPTIDRLRELGVKLPSAKEIDPRVFGILGLEPYDEGELAPPTQTLLKAI